MTEPYRSPPFFVVLHSLRCIDAPESKQVAMITGMTFEKVTELLKRLRSRGLVEHDPGPFGGWTLTSAGLATEQELSRSELEESGVGDHVYRCYRSFKRLHGELLAVGTDWETRPVGGTRVLNNHRNAEYDTSVLSRLVNIDEGTQWIYAELAGLLERFGVYGRRFSFALEHALAGETSYVTGSTNSYQTVWLQLHEDLLATLGISRNDERSGATG